MYASLHDFTSRHGITLAGKFAGPWRLTKPFVGWINALSATTCGILRITNGIDCVIERSDGSLFWGHLDWFVKDPAHRAQPSGSPAEYAQRKTQRKSAVELERLMEEYK